RAAQRRAGPPRLAPRRHRAFAPGPCHREQPLARRDQHLHRARAAFGSVMKSVRMLSTGAYLPGEPIDNEQMAALVGPVPDDVLEGARLYLERGDYRTALVIGSETISPLLVPVFHDKDPDKIRMRDRLGLYSFGDAAAAMVLRGEDGDGPGILGSAIASVGGGR